MANEILTPQIIANEALMVLQSNLTMANLVHRDYSSEFVKVGDTISVRKPATFVAKNFTGQTEAQDITEGSVTVKMDRFRDITVNVGSKEMTLDIKNFSEQVITPAMQAMAQQIDADLLAVGISKAGKKATVSKTPAITDIAGVGKALDQAKAPRTDRRLVLPPTILYLYNTLDNFAKQCYKGDSIALKESEIGYLPRPRGRLRQQFPGAVLASLGWTVVTFGFSIYVTYFNGFSMYGSLTTIVILLIWLYVCMNLVLVGAYINKILVDKELEID